MIKFVWRKVSEPDKIIFANVLQDAFFVDDGKNLCQKINGSTYTIIADQAGAPCADLETNIDGDYEIIRIIGKPDKIEF